jgi:hypothetical protein|tara:strand:+ start:2677 stop:2790 length:114 start_codon:yes stop_codon:yes gene_type:complete
MKDCLHLPTRRSPWAFTLRRDMTKTGIFRDIEPFKLV